MYRKDLDPAHIRKIAEEYYRSGQYYCSEAIVKTINEEFRLGYPDDIVKVASGFPIGIGGAGCSCGAVTGGVMAIGMVFGRSAPGDPAIERCLSLCRGAPRQVLGQARMPVLPLPYPRHDFKISRTHPEVCSHYRRNCRRNCSNNFAGTAVSWRLSPSIIKKAVGLP